MENKSEKKNQADECAENLDRKIDGELTLEDLSKVVGGLPAGPIYNGKSYARLKSRFGVD